MRKHTRKVFVGEVGVGGNSPVSVQTMTTVKTSDIEKIINQIKLFEKEGCDISRSAINDQEDAKAIPIIKSLTKIPFVADIQFDRKLALAAVENDCDCLRYNPGNIGSVEKVKELVSACKEKNIPVRIGVNSGSVSKNVIKKFGGVNSDSLVYSALEQVKLLESLDFRNIIISVKSSDVNTMIESYEKLSESVNYPLHLGVTEAGPYFRSIIKSSIGIGHLLKKGIGDTIRVSITGDPVEEIKTGKMILNSLGLGKDGFELVSCPTCSRTSVELEEIVNEVEKKLSNIKTSAKIAVMGCPVNGPGEAKDADIGIACAKGTGFLFKKGVTVKKVAEKDIVKTLVEEVEAFENEMRSE